MCALNYTIHSGQDYAFDTIETFDWATEGIHNVTHTENHACNSSYPVHQLTCL